MYHCTRDGCSYPNGFYTETLPALGHDDTVVTVKEPTCTEDGSAAGLLLQMQAVHQRDHPREGAQSDDDDRCPGDLQQGRLCVRLLRRLQQDDPEGRPHYPPASGAEHKWDSGRVTTPTCTDRRTSLLVCGDTKTEAIAATGMTVGRHVVTKQPTRTSPSAKQRRVQNRAIPGRPHDGREYPSRDRRRRREPTGPAIFVDVKRRQLV